MNQKSVMCSLKTYESGVESRMVNLSEMRAFLNHPFQVENDGDYHYEIISGHRRRMAAEMVGFDTVPAIIRDIDDDQAVIAMTDSNLHREHIKPSEKAFAYKPNSL